MPSMSVYKSLLGGIKTGGQARKYESDNVMLETWYEDISSRVAYIYDYYHDDEPLIYTNLQPEKSKTKIPVDIKFLVNSYNSESKDQVGYHIQFKPGQECSLDYYKDSVGKKYDTEYPIACYLDIPDESGIYRKWLCVGKANWLGTQFPTWYVLPIDHVFQWVDNGNMYQMCGVSRSQSSYNAGQWVDQYGLLFK